MFKRLIDMVCGRMWDPADIRWKTYRYRYIGRFRTVKDGTNYGERGEEKLFFCKK
jgi:hypothetical protein